MSAADLTGPAARHTARPAALPGWRAEASTRVLAWLRGRDLTLVVLFAVGIGAAGIASFVALMHVAAAAGWPAPIQPLLPLSLDVLAVAGTRAWLTGTAATGVRRYGQIIAAAAVSVSVGGNLLYGAIGLAPGFVAPWQLLVATHAVPPLVVFAIAHLATLSRAPMPKPARRRPAAPAPTPAPKVPDTAREPAPAAAPADLPAAGELPAGRPDPADPAWVAWVAAAEADAGRRLGRPALTRMLRDAGRGAGSDKVAALLAAAHQDQPRLTVAG